MSIRRNLSITPQARIDIKNILKFTQKTWGSEQRKKYKQILYDTFNKIAANPMSGNPREELRPSYYSYHVGSNGRHYIFYRILDDNVEVVRVLHDSMDIGQHLPE